MDSFTIKKVGPIGDYDAKYGQRFWGTVEEAQMEVSFNTMDRNADFKEGQKIAFEERLIKTTRGSEDKPPRDYLFLRKVRLLTSGSQEEAVPTPAPQSIKSELVSSPAATSGQVTLIMSKLNDIHKDIKKLMGEENVVEPTPNEISGKDEIDLSEIPF